MGRRKAFLPSVGEPLEERLVPSHGSSVFAPALIGLSRAHHKRLVLTGQLEGTSRIDRPSIPDTGTKILLTGSGLVRALGHVDAGGWLRQAGLIRLGRDAGVLTLNNALGSVTLSLQRPFNAAGPGHSGPFRFHIMGGTGAYDGATGGGTAKLVLGDPTLCTRAVPGGCQSTGGSFVLTLKS
jgi:hypothetical protein